MTTKSRPIFIKFTKPGLPGKVL